MHEHAGDRFVDGLTSINEAPAARQHATPWPHRCSTCNGSPSGRRRVIPRVDQRCPPIPRPSDARAVAARTKAPLAAEARQARLRTTSGHGYCCPPSRKLGPCRQTFATMPTRSTTPLSRWGCQLFSCPASVGRCRSRKSRAFAACTTGSGTCSPIRGTVAVSQPDTTDARSCSFQLAPRSRPPSPGCEACLWSFAQLSQHNTNHDNHCAEPAF